MDNWQKKRQRDGEGSVCPHFVRTFTHVYSVVIIINCIMSDFENNSPESETFMCVCNKLRSVMERQDLTFCGCAKVVCYSRDVVGAGTNPLPGRGRSSERWLLTLRTGGGWWITHTHHGTAGVPLWLLTVKADTPSFFKVLLMERGCSGMCLLECQGACMMPGFWDCPHCGS